MDKIQCEPDHLEYGKQRIFSPEIRSPGRCLKLPDASTPHLPLSISESKVRTSGALRTSRRARCASGESSRFPSTLTATFQARAGSEFNGSIGRLIPVS